MALMTPRKRSQEAGNVSPASQIFARRDDAKANQRRDPPHVTDDRMRQRNETGKVVFEISDDIRPSFFFLMT
ncbi:hypothetical protein F2P81_015649 [Scophthalmus maximus]|uniref:Uncharacterized protein n=1 Tax=Scophthalmus maximus TaxID=52904 RepID=A0A6A4SJE1_SCOMX|nr:hypothetical protein F2P81_015649 [Scophthalmus maximus]